MKEPPRCPTCDSKMVWLERTNPYATWYCHFCGWKMLNPVNKDE